MTRARNVVDAHIVHDDDTIVLVSHLIGPQPFMFDLKAPMIALGHLFDAELDLMNVETSG